MESTTIDKIKSQINQRIESYEIFSSPEVKNFIRGLEVALDIIQRVENEDQ